MKSKLFTLLFAVLLAGSSNTILAQGASLSIDKQFVNVTGGNGNAVADAVGDVLHYTVQITNNGSVTLTGVIVSDPLTGGTLGTISALAPGASQTFSTAYGLTQADLNGAGNAGSDHDIDNMATADSDQTGPVSDNVTVPLVYNPLLAIDKQFINVTGGNGNGLADAIGDVLHYTVKITNTGNVTLTNISLVDPLTGLNNSNLLAPGASITIGTSYTLTQADLNGAGNAGSDFDIDNIATADPDQTDPVSDMVTVPLGNADLAITKTDGVTDVTAGDGIVRTYTITVTNNGPTLANAIVVADTWPTGFQRIAVGIPPGTSVNPIFGNSDFTWSIPMLNTGASITLSVSYVVPAATNSGFQTNRVTVSSSTPDPNVGNNTDTDMNFVHENVVLTIAKDFSNPGNDGAGDTPEETVIAGGPSQTFFITVTNTGVSTADNVLITDIVPGFLRVSNVTGTLGQEVANPNLNDNDIEWLIPTLGSGQSITLTVTYSVGSAVDPRLANNTASVYSDETIENEETPVQDGDDVRIIRNVVLVVEKDFSNNDPADLPEEVVTAGSSGNTFRIVITNTGLSATDVVHIRDIVPSSLTVTNVSAARGVQNANPTLNDNDIAWTIVFLGAGESVTLTVTYSVAAGETTQLVNNTAIVTAGDVAAPVLNSDDVQIVENVNLTIDKEFQDASVIAGTGNHVFTILVTNTGSSVADNVTIIDVVHHGLVVTSVTEFLGGAVSLLNGTLSASLPHLGPGQTWALIMTYDVPISTPTMSISNTAVADCEEVSPVSDTDQISIINNTICPKSKGYWKNHPEAWPASAIPMTLGSVLYSHSHLLTILNMSTGNGNGNNADASIILAQQLIAAKLNIASGVSSDPIAQVIEQSDVLLAGYNGAFPYKVRPNTPAGQNMLFFANILDDFNNGQMTIGCFLPPATTSNNSTTSALEEAPALIPERFVLEQNSPNPASSLTTIRYKLPETNSNSDHHVTLKVYDIYGREVATVVNAMQSAGYKSVQFDVNRLAAGIYLYRLTAGSFSETKKIVVAR